MPCSQCQHQNNVTAKFCEECGARLVHICPHCGHEVSPRAKFCEECATPLAGYTSSSSPALPTRRGADAEVRFYALLSEVMGLLQRERRVTYRRLTYLFTLDHVLVGDLREELALRRLAVDEEGKVLVWTGEAQPAVQPAVAPTRPPALPEAVAVTSPPPPALASSITATDTPHDEPIVSPEALPTDASPEEGVAVSEHTHAAPEAERRHLTVMFCDLADSTKLSQQLDPEDLHWADPSTLEMLGLVLEQTPTVPMLSVLTFRPEFTPPWPTRSHMTPITLNHLERAQVEALITHLAGGKALPDEVVQHIVAKTDGVPLYVEELTKMLLASDLLRAEAEQYVLTGPRLSVAIPETLQDSLMARLDQMNTAKEVAQLGAVLGREFPYEMLQSLSPLDEATLQDGLAQLVAVELLYQRGRPPRARYIFKHALIQDAAYASLLRSTRQQVHQQIARLLETRFPETVATQPELVAHNYTEAGCHERAIGYWLLAGQRAAARSAHAEAVAHLTRGLEVLTSLPEHREYAEQELALYIALGTSIIATKGWAAPDVEKAYTRARELCRQVGETSQLFPVLWVLWSFYLVRGELQTSLELAEQGLDLVQHQQNPTFLVAAHLTLGQTLCLRGAFTRAQRHLEQRRSLYTPQRHRSYMSLFGSDPGVFCLSFEAHNMWCLGYPDQARIKTREAVAPAQELSNTFSLALALTYAATFQQFVRERHTAHEHAEAAMALCTEQGFAYYLAWATMIQGWTLVTQGDAQAGVTRIRQGLADLSATGGRLRQPYYLALQAEVYSNMGQVEQGLTLLAESQALQGKDKECWYEAELCRLKGELLLKRTTPDKRQAETCFQQALAVARHQQAKSWELRAAMSLARLWQSQGKRQDAYNLLAPVYNWFTEGFDTADLKDAKSLLDELSSAKGVSRWPV